MSGISSVRPVAEPGMNELADGGPKVSGQEQTMNGGRALRAIEQRRFKINQILQDAKDWEMERQVGPLSVVVPGDSTIGYVKTIAQWVEPQDPSLATALLSSGKGVAAALAIMLGTPAARLGDTISSVIQVTRKLIDAAPPGAYLPVGQDKVLLQELDKLDAQLRQLKENERQTGLAWDMAQADALEAAKQAAREMCEADRFTAETGNYQSTPPSPSPRERVDALEAARQSARELCEPDRFTEQTGEYRSTPPPPQPSARVDALEKARQAASEMCEPDRFTQGTGRYQSLPASAPPIPQLDALEEAKRAAQELCKPDRFTEQSGAPQSRLPETTAEVPPDALREARQAARQAASAMAGEGAQAPALGIAMEAALDAARDYLRDAAMQAAQTAEQGVPDTARSEWGAEERLEVMRDAVLDNQQAALEAARSAALSAAHRATEEMSFGVARGAVLASAVGNDWEIGAATSQSLARDAAQWAARNIAPQVAGQVSQQAVEQAVEWAEQQRASWAQLSVQSQGQGFPGA